MRRLAVLLPLALIAACSDPDPQAAAVDAEREIALVEQANKAPPPARQVVPEAIGAPEMERHQLTGEGCNYAPGTSLGARVLAGPQDAWMKIDGEMMRFAADSGATQLAAGSWDRYLSAGYELLLALAEDPSDHHYDGTITLRDPHGRIVYRGTGYAQCNPV
ncbi:hypothetical protein PK98_04520 [Croceibacterium mercuriale]|uniref:Lipoprotein n=2 Tax=Croceibacterium mercuriale TaxID=1572751 RepID=A0A0B2C1L5_9SPHN|nr:hypothetical protein PK98_04520 [Croceibacterium mercuriale]